MTIKEKTVSFLLQCKRVWHLLRKPSVEEWKSVSKISAAGIGIIGLLGFLISLIMVYFMANLG
jgi:protein transport protein SEC61 subunit gamma and related proteins